MTAVAKLEPPYERRWLGASTRIHAIFLDANAQPSWLHVSACGVLGCTVAVVDAASLALTVWQLIGSQRYGQRPSRVPAHSVQRR